MEFRVQVENNINITVKAISKKGAVRIFYHVNAIQWNNFRRDNDISKLMIPESEKDFIKIMIEVTQGCIIKKSNRKKERENG